MPSCCITATNCTENASLISNRSTSASAHPIFSANRRIASTGVISTYFGARPLVAWPTMRAMGVTPRHDDKGGRAVVDGRSIARGDSSVLLERGLQRCQRVQTRVGSDGLVAIEYQ